MNQRKPMLIGTGIAVAVVIVIGLVLAIVLLPSGSADQTASPSTTPTAEQTTPTEQTSPESTVHATTFARNLPDDPMAIGDIDAPVLMIEWADLRCHYCGVFANETLPGLISEYVDAGLLRIEWHSAVVLGDTSADAAVAARAAGQQDLFWEYIEAIYATEPTGQTVWDRDALVGIAESIPGMDVAQFTADLDDPELIAAAQAETQQSIDSGITGTPMFVVGSEVLQGAQPLENFAAVIDAQLG
ncbi:DsbA family protein [Cellulomonas sp. NPDC089187]|uniref:DsbA family protein n=1 Tax=Cellulomonas sp. NPDC089187 TaxID=3154970 RepID=UPI00343DB113